MYYLSDNIKNLNRIFDQNKRQDYLRLDLNENPGGLPKEFVEKVVKKITPEFVSQYPETLDFTRCLASHIDTDIDHLCLVNGSAEGIRYIIEAFTSEGGKIVGVTPTYAMFDVYSRMYNRNFLGIEYTEDLQMPVERILEKLTEDVQLLILVNPNNPMGNVYSEAEFELILARAQDMQITILVDEAYHYFCPNTFVKYALKNEHIFITRTFSKLFSMAGARLGYVIGWPEGISMIQKMCTPHNVNAFAELFAQSILEEEGLLTELIEKNQEGRNYLTKRLRENNYAYQGEMGNFIFIKQKTSAETLVNRMKKEKGILIKSYQGVGNFGNCLRVTVAEKQYMERFMDALIELDQ